MLRRLRWVSALLVAAIALMSACAALAESPSDYNKNVPQLLREGHIYAESAVLVDAENGTINGTEVYNCGGSLEVGGWPIHCAKRIGHGALDNLSVLVHHGYHPSLNQKSLWNPAVYHE